MRFLHIVHVPGHPQERRGQGGDRLRRRRGKDGVDQQPVRQVAEHSQGLRGGSPGENKGLGQVSDCTRIKLNQIGLEQRLTYNLNFAPFPIPGIPGIASLPTGEPSSTSVAHHASDWKDVPRQLRRPLGALRYELGKTKFKDDFILINLIGLQH